MPQAFTIARRFIDDVISSPINICLVALICYFSYKLFKKDSRDSIQDRDGSGAGGAHNRNGRNRRNVLEKLPKQDFTRDQLKFYDGIKSEGRILVAVLGKVFDVSTAADFYGPGGPYSIFAGRDASRALAQFSVEPSLFRDTYDDLSDLKPSQLDSVKEWEMQFLEKYPVVGKLLKPDEEATNYDEENNEDMENKKDD